MLRAKLVKNGASGAGRISGIMVVACLILGCSRPAFSSETTDAPDEQPHLQLAPIRIFRSVGGDMGYIFQRTTIGGSKFTEQSLGVGINAAVNVRSFLWQPWFAKVGSNLNASANSTRTISNTTPPHNSVNTYIDGDAYLDLVEASRFPFEARIFRRDSRYAAFYSGTNSVSQLTGYNLTQAYVTPNRRTQGRASFTSNKSSGPYINPSYMDTFNFDLTMQTTRTQSITISGNTDREKLPAKGQSSLYESLVANHAYQPSYTFSVASVANLFKMDSLAQVSNQPQQHDANALQFNSLLSFRPEKSPLTMTSSVRFLNTGSSSNGILGPTLTSSNFNLGANYLFSPLLRMYGAVNVADSFGTQTASADLALTAAKGYGARKATAINTHLGGFLYSGSIGGTIATSISNTTTTHSANQTTTQSAQRLNLNLGVYLSHALDKTSQLGAGLLSENLHQTLSEGFDPINHHLSISRLISGGSLLWRQAQGRETTLFQLSATDARNLTGPQSTFQMINLQASRSEAMSRNESLKGSLTVQATRSQVSGITTPYALAPSAEMAYRNQRVFKVLNLTFESILRIADSNIAPATQYAYQDVATRAWDNNFAYHIGRLNMSLNTQIAKIGSTLQSSIRFIMSRSF